MILENIVNFIRTHQSEVETIVRTDMFDRLILNTTGGLINHCLNQKVCRKIIPIFSSTQMGEKDAVEISLFTRKLYNKYI